MPLQLIDLHDGVEFHGIEIEVDDLVAPGLQDLHDTPVQRRQVAVARRMRVDDVDLHRMPPHVPDPGLRLVERHCFA